MALQKIINNVWAALQAPFLWRSTPSGQVDQIDQSIGNGYQYSWWDSTFANENPIIGLDTDNQIRLGEAVQNPVRESVTVHIYPNAKLVTQTIFTNPTPKSLTISGISAVFTTAGSVAGATCNITHETAVGGVQQAAGTGKTVQTGTFDLHATAATVQNGVRAANYLRASRATNVASNNPGTGVIVLQPGDSLSIVFAGTLTTLVGVTVTLYMFPGSKYHFVSYVAAGAATQATTSLLTSMRPRTLLYGAALWGVKGSDAGAVTLDITKDASGTAPGAGTSMLSATTSLKGTANTYTQLALSATAANLVTASTDSVAFKLTGTPTALAGLCVTLAFAGNPGEVQIDYNAQNSTVGTDEEFWIADRDYEVLDFAAKWSTVSTARIIGLTSETGTNTPASGGVVLQTDNTNAGFLTSGTVNIPVFATLAAKNKLYVRQGDRLGLKNDSGTLASLAGFQLSARLRAM